MPLPTTRPQPRAPALTGRRRTRQIHVAGVAVGGDAPVSVQSMTTTPTTDADATLRQIAELTAAGCQIVRVAVPSQDDADALPVIAAKSKIPVIAEIHFQPRYVFAGIDAVSCPSCGRAQVDVYALTAKVSAAFDGFPHPLRVAVMGCVVNGPGEAREADLGVSSGNGKGQIFVLGEIVRTVPEAQIVDAPIKEALCLTEPTGSAAIPVPADTGRSPADETAPRNRPDSSR
ncbi:flavodoxin-dependent (E)-4-hydroxy-3-methylbut-2-enyl-diphosphate synthase [Streptomyces sp. NPDC048417]|uniref:flavodoxin-dependent (E)-4-hydroxy-3-methylbut-2-enyl-diphosphate synthase n=1 Tax=Streptomyces sp. NPDC048417 TaxID=3155387 RepID=UPI0034389975